MHGGLLVAIPSVAHALSNTSVLIDPPANALLAALSRDKYLCFLEAMEHAALAFGDLLCETGGGGQVCFLSKRFADFAINGGGSATWC